MNLERYMKAIKPPCQITFRSQTGMVGTLMKALGRAVGQLVKFTIVLGFLLLGRWGWETFSFKNEKINIVDLLVLERKGRSSCSGINPIIFIVRDIG